MRSDTFDLEAWLQQGKDRLEQLYNERERIDREIALLKGALADLQPLSRGTGSGANPGLIKSMRLLFRSETNRLFSPTEIRDELLKQGLSLRQRNPMAAIHQTLARLLTNKEVRVHVTDGRTLYQHEELATRTDMKTRANDSRLDLPEKT